MKAPRRLEISVSRRSRARERKALAPPSGIPRENRISLGIRMGCPPCAVRLGMAQKWSPDTWRGKPIRQVPDYPDGATLSTVEATLRHRPPLVFAGEARRLKHALGEVAE